MKLPELITTSFEEYEKLANKISKLINKDLSKSYVRLEIIGDKKGFLVKAT